MTELADQADQARKQLADELSHENLMKMCLEKISTTEQFDCVMNASTFEGLEKCDIK